MQTGITTAVLKGANAPASLGLAKDANGQRTGDEPSVLRMEGDPHCDAPAIAYERYAPPSDAVCHGEGS
jgi:hypothetical protein